jgi:hypothetical protein
MIAGRETVGLMTRGFCYDLLSTDRNAWRPLKRAWVVLLLPLILASSDILRAQQDTEEMPDVSGNYSFLTADDNLGLLEEEGKLKGDVDVVQGEDESDAILSYSISSGWRKKNQVEFKTRKIHQKYYRFSGVVQRGSGHEERDPDFLRLVGDLQIITVNSESGEEIAQRKHVIFKSKGRTAEEEY